MNKQLILRQEPTQVFHHLSKYRVVICTICRYAVPPRAVNRHLKEIHGAHHSLRPKFVKFVEDLDLCEPEDVIPPTEDDFPIPELTVLRGLRCSFGNCGHLCLTEKRMKNHLASAQHPYVSTEQPWCSVLIQTFFHGNRLKYFSGSSQTVESRLENSKNGNASLMKRINSSHGWQLADGPPQKLSSLVLNRQIHVDSDVEGLLYYYQTSTYATISTNAGHEVIWQQTAIQLAREHEFLLLAIQALTSLHIAYLNPELRNGLLLQATLYQDKAMSMFRIEIAAPTPQNCHAIIVFHHLLVLYTFAAEYQNDSLFLIDRESDEVVPLWLHFIRSACDILCDVWDWIEAGPCRALALAWEEPFEISKAYEQSVFERLLASIPATSSENAWALDIVDLYMEAASELATAFACSESSSNQFSTWDVLRIWPVKLSAEFMALLREEHPSALVLLAHYTVLLKRIEDVWYFHDRAKRLLRIIHGKLDPYWHPYIPEA
jgi:hypothetical protein